MAIDPPDPSEQDYVPSVEPDFPEGWDSDLDSVPTEEE